MFNLKTNSGEILRFGILVNSNLLKKWQVEIISDLISKGHILQLVISPHHMYDYNKIKTSLFNKVFHEKSLYNLFDRLFLRGGMLENIDSTNFLSNFEKLEVYYEKLGKHSQIININDVEIIKKYNLDIILRFGFNILKGEILNAAKMGIWSFHHDDEQVIRGGPPGFWEIYGNHKVNGILVQRLTEKLDSGLVVSKSYIPVLKHSYKTHLNELLRIGGKQIIMDFERLSKGFSIDFSQIVSNAPVFKKPSNIQMLRFLVIVFFNKIAFHAKDLFRHEDWNVGFLSVNFDSLISKQKRLVVNWLEQNDSDIFKADPFVFIKNRIPHVIYEEYSYAAATASLVIKNMTDFYDGTTSKHSESHHLAFPFVIQTQVDLLCIPETTSSGKSKIYKFGNQNHDLVEAGFLDIPYPAIDPVIIFHEGLYWLFCTHKEFGTNNNLFLYSSNSIFEKWESHPQNPIVSDVRKSRMAGSVLFVDGKIIRPAQCNDVFYGNGISFHQIDVLDKQSYQESFFGKLEPHELNIYKNGTHTINYLNGHFVVDGKKYKLVWSEFYKRLKRKIFNND